MAKASHTAIRTEKQRVERAFKRIEAEGGMTMTGLCCRTCSWAALEDMGADDNTTCAFHHVQCTDLAFPKGSQGWLQNPLYIYHSGDSRFICEILEAEGLRVEWGGDPDKAIEVLPGRRN